jgi:hypothetical protein
LQVCDMGCDYRGVLDPLVHAGLIEVFLPPRRYLRISAKFRLLC